MSFLFDSFERWKNYCEQHKLSLSDSVLEYEQAQKGRVREETINGLRNAWQVMKEAVKTGLEENMTSRSGMINNGAKKVYNFPKAGFVQGISKSYCTRLAAKEVNSCMGRIVAAPTAGASGIMPGVLFTLQEIHHIDDEKIIEAMLIAAGIALIMEQKASIAGAVGVVRQKPEQPPRWVRDQSSIVSMETPIRSSMQ